jgi:hypothetical protein
MTTGKSSIAHLGGLASILVGLCYVGATISAGQLVPSLLVLIKFGHTSPSGTTGPQQRRST